MDNLSSTALKGALEIIKVELYTSNICNRKSPTYSHKHGLLDSSLPKKFVLKLAVQFALHQEDPKNDNDAFFTRCTRIIHELNIQNKSLN